MTAPVLRVSDTVGFPVSLVTQTLAIMAISGAGKSNAGAVLAEELYDAGLPFVVLDPKGDWWGLRSDRDGTGPGLPIPIIGGPHGDIPLHPGSAALIADLIVDQNLTCIIDVSDLDDDLMPSFLADLGGQLFHRHGRDPQARHLILEEADEILPQSIPAGAREAARCVRVWARIAKQGRTRGLGLTIISQRCAEVSKKALSQCATLIALRTIGALDRKAILDWISFRTDARDIVTSLPMLADGECQAVSPHWLPRSGLPETIRFRWRRRRTFDSGATPEPGRVRRPATLADIDLGALSDRLAATAEEAAAADPALLRARITELEKQLAAGAPASPRTAALAAENAELRARASRSENALRLSSAALATLRQIISGLTSAAAQVYARLDEAPSDTPAAAAPPEQPPAAPPRPGPSAPQAPPPRADRSLPPRQRAILTVLAQHPDGRSKAQLAIQAGSSPKSSTFDNNLGALRRAGLVNRGQPIQITDEGRVRLGAWDLLPTGRGLADYWLRTVSQGAERAILQVLLDAWPEPLSKTGIGTASGYSPTSSTLDNALGRLRKLQLVTGYRDDIRASATLGAAMHETAPA